MPERVGPVFNIAAFSDPNSSANLTARGSYAFGDMPRVSGAMRMPAYLSEDFNFLKRTRFTESKDLLLEVNLINAFNHIWNRPEDLNPFTGNIPFGRLSITNFSNIGGGRIFCYLARYNCS